MASPYRRQKRRAFWKSVQNIDPANADFHAFYEPKFDLKLGEGSSVATLGSCFAQNIRRELLARGLNFADYEAAPAFFPVHERKTFGYDLFSVRSGNIYTARQLRQLAEEALTGQTWSDTVWEEKKAFLDPLRPTIQPDGFTSPEDLKASRTSHLRSTEALLKGVDTLIFTLGLTETWLNQEDGMAYPMCPGTVGGKFDAEQHVLQNATYRDIKSDLEAFLSLVQAVNPTFKLVLTVSPVPLMATATPEHVVVATTYSKSVLRAVAGDLRTERENVDYFPSYEIFTSPIARGSFFQPDMRNPAPEGVAKAMSTFFNAHCPQEDTEQRPVKKPERREAQAENDAFLERQEEICDEMLLENELRD